MTRLQCNKTVLLFTLFIAALWLTCCESIAQSAFSKKETSIRIATFNVALNRKKEGALLQELESGNPKEVTKIAAIIQMVRPDVLLINEIDFDGGKSLESFEKKFLGKGQHGQEAIEYSYRYVELVNTGIDTAMDLNGDRRMGTADDAFGYGRFPGQYGMAVLSMYPIDEEKIRTFQNFLWKDMPDALLPTDPESGKSWYSEEALEIFRLSSKSHWDLPISVGSGKFHFLVCHPTPPVFDREEDRNGKRNHDEIRLWADYVNDDCDWLYDDKGQKGGLPSGTNFVIAGDLNADPVDGDSTDNAIDQLLKHELILSDLIPASSGGKHYAEKDAGANLTQKGDPQYDTANFNDKTVGNVRIDYVLPSKTMTVTNQGVFWPAPGEPGSELSNASDHRLVWIDVELPE